jgi:hypothetical protein
VRLRGAALASEENRGGQRTVRAGNRDRVLIRTSFCSCRDNRMIGGGGSACRGCSRPRPVNRRLTDKAFAQVLLRG